MTDLWKVTLWGELPYGSTEGPFGALYGGCTWRCGEAGERFFFKRQLAGISIHPDD